MKKIIMAMILTAAAIAAYECKKRRTAAIEAECDIDDGDYISSDCLCEKCGLCGSYE